MPDMTPVGNTIIPPNPMTGINTLSGILGIQQQQQQLAGQTAQTQQLQQRNSELQALATFTRNAAKDPSYLNADGSPNVEKYQRGAQQVAPVYGPEYVGQMTSNFNSAISNRKALLGLSNDQRATVGNYLGAVAAKPDATEDDLKDAIEQARTVSPDRGYQRAITDFAFSVPHTENMTTAQASTTIRNAARAAALATGAPNAAAVTGLSIPQQASTGAGVVNREPTTGAITAPPGAAPGSAINPTPPQVAGATAGATGGAGRDVDRANAVSTAQQSASASMPLTVEVDRLSHEISASTIAGRVTEGLKNLGFTDVANARSQLNKDLGLLKGPLALRAASDSRAATVLEGYPTETTPENTTHAAMDYIRGMFRQTMARGQLLRKHGQEGFAAADDELTRSTDPLVYEASSLKPGQSNGFYRRNFGSPQEAQAFKDRVDALKKHTGYLGGE